MAAPATEHVRNVVLVGQDGAGKTSLAEAMLYVSGKTPRMGTTHDGKSYLDYDAEEIKRKFTIGTSIAPIPYKDYKINVLDTSGHPDFICDTLSTMQAAEMALFVVDAVAGPQVMTTKLWREAEGMRLSRAVFINHIDREHADFDMAMATLHARFGSRLGPVTIPIGQDADFKGVIDIIRMEARYFGEGDDSERIEPIPAEFADAAQAARDKLCDLVAEADDELMMKYLEGEEQLTQDELESLLDKAIAQELFIPVFVGSTIIKQGIQGLMEDICTYFPHPRSHGRFQMADGTSIPIDETNRPAAFAFKTLSDPFVGRLSFLKVLSGVLEPGMELINARTGKKERLGHLYVMMGKEATDVKSAKAGDIIVVPKLAETRTGDTISLTGEIAVDPLPLPVPQYPVAIEAVNKKEEDKLGTFLARAAENDPSIHIQRNEETHQTVLTAMGDTQVDMLISRCKEQTGVDVRLVPVRIPYRETIRKTAEAEGRHKKQTGGAGQFGDCWLRISPNPGAGYEFVDEIKGGAIPGGLIPAVDKGRAGDHEGRRARRVPDGRHQGRRVRRQLSFRRLQRDGVQDRRAHRFPRRVRPGRSCAARADGRHGDHGGRGLCGSGYGRYLHAPRPHRRHRLQRRGRDCDHRARALRRDREVHEGFALDHARLGLVQHPAQRLRAGACRRHKEARGGIPSLKGCRKLKTLPRPTDARRRLRNKGVDGYHAAGPLCACREAARVGGASAFPFVRFSFAFPIRLSVRSFSHALRANSSSRRRDARPSQPADSTLRVEVDCALSGSLSCACSRF